MALSASDLQTVYSLLVSSLSADESVRKPVESTLAQCESRAGFCSCLLEVIGAKDLASQVDVRLMASVYFKNSINRYWRHRRDSLGVGNDEKSHIRKKLLLHLREENFQIAVQLSVLVSKIARIDYPKEWPELFPTLAQQLESADILGSQRLLMVLFQILKELSSKRLSSDQRNFREIASHLFEFIWNLWKTDVQKILQSLSGLLQSFPSSSLGLQQGDLILICERWIFCSKIIRQLVICGYPSDTTSPEDIAVVKEVCPVILNAIQSLLPLYSSFQEGNNRLWEFVKQGCTKLMKILVRIQGRHPYSFANGLVLPLVLDLCLNKITSPESEIASFEQFMIQCMVMVKSILECKDYKAALTGHVINETATKWEERKRSISVSVADILAKILPNERIILLCNVLIRRYVILTENDLDAWHQSPESFHHEQDMVQWTEKLRPCAEALYIVLFENYRELLAPVIVSLLREAKESCPSLETEITPRMLLKDAAYTAAGHVYYELSSYFSFNDWFNGTLSVELSNSHPNMRIIHRKIALVLGQWVSEIKGDNRKVVFSSLITLLQDPDVAVRLASCRSLCFLLGDSNVSEGGLNELLPTCWIACFKLVEDVQEFDSKVQVLNLISVSMEHAGEKITPFAKYLAGFFQKIWEESTGESLLQIQLLNAVRNFVCSLGYQSPICYEMLLPILQKGIDINNPDELNLLEDSILLWEATLSHAPSLIPQLLDLFPYLVGIIERNFDHLQEAVVIIEDYIISAGSEFLNRHSSSLAKILDLIVGGVNEKGLLSTLPIIDLLIQCFPTEAPPMIHGVLQKLIVVCLSAGDDHNPSAASVRVSCGAIIARLLVMNSVFLAHLTSDPSLGLLLQQAGISVDQNVLLCLVDLWLDKIDSVYTIQRKAYALALSIILTLRLPEVMDKLDEILSVCTSVILGGSEETSGEESSDTTCSSGSLVDGVEHNGIPIKELRKRQMRALDPIRQLSLEGMLRDNLQACAALHGQETFNAVINRIHPSALAQLQQALKMA